MNLPVSPSPHRRQPQPHTWSRCLQSVTHRRVHNTAPLEAQPTCGSLAPAFATHGNGHRVQGPRTLFARPTHRCRQFWEPGAEGNAPAPRVASPHTETVPVSRPGAPSLLQSCHNPGAWPLPAAWPQPLNHTAGPRVMPSHFHVSSPRDTPGLGSTALASSRLSALKDTRFQAPRSSGSPKYKYPPGVQSCTQAWAPSKLPIFCV